MTLYLSNRGEFDKARHYFEKIIKSISIDEWSKELISKGQTLPEWIQQLNAQDQKPPALASSFSLLSLGNGGIKRPRTEEGEPNEEAPPQNDRVLKKLT